MTCLKLRHSLLNTFYKLPNVSEFICDVLLGCPHPDVRVAMAGQLNQLCADIDTGEGGVNFLETGGTGQ